MEKTNSIQDQKRCFDEIDRKHMKQSGRIRDYENQVIHTDSRWLEIMGVDPIWGVDSVVVYNSIFILF